MEWLDNSNTKVVTYYCTLQEEQYLNTWLGVPEGFCGQLEDNDDLAQHTDYSTVQKLAKNYFQAPPTQ
eukprot:2160190-Ditylum_brightwellii.AAC.1